MGLNGRWLKIRSLLESFPIYRKDTFKRNKRYMKSERYR
jgi:branched-chain amino acid transport system permease protein